MGTSSALIHATPRRTMSTSDDRCAQCNSVAGAGAAHAPAKRTPCSTSLHKHCHGVYAVHSAAAMGFGAAPGSKGVPPAQLATVLPPVPMPRGRGTSGTSGSRLHAMLLRLLACGGPDAEPQGGVQDDSLAAAGSSRRQFEAQRSIGQGDAQAISEPHCAIASPEVKGPVAAPAAICDSSGLQHRSDSCSHQHRSVSRLLKSSADSYSCDTPTEGRHASAATLSSGAGDNPLERLSRSSQTSTNSIPRVLSTNMSGNGRKLTPSASMQLRASLGPRLACSRSLHLMLSAASTSRHRPSKVCPTSDTSPITSGMGSPSLSRSVSHVVGARRLSAIAAPRHHASDAPMAHARIPDLIAIERRALHRNSESCGSRLGTPPYVRCSLPLPSQLVGGACDHVPTADIRNCSDSCLPDEVIAPRLSAGVANSLQGLVSADNVLQQPQRCLSRLEKSVRGSVNGESPMCWVEVEARPPRRPL